MPGTVPAAPLVHGFPRDRAAVLRWTPPNDGGAPIQHYVIERRAGPDWIHVATTTGTTLYVTGLTNGTTVVFRVAAVNAVGTGAFFGVPVTPRIPSSPRIDAVVSRSRALYVRWLWADDGPLGYRLERRTVGSSTWVHVTTTSARGTNYLIPSLVNGTAYDVRVGALFEGGVTRYSDVVRATAGTPPAAPAGLTLSGGLGVVRAQWGYSPNNGGSAITGYRLQLSFTGTNWQDCACMLDDVTPATIRTTVRSAQFAATPGRRIYARVAAVNAVGTGTTSTVVSAVVYDYPDPPAYFDVFPGFRSAFVSWDQPEYTGFAPIRNYQVQIRPVASSTWTTVGTTTGLWHNITGLVNGARYCVRVIAWNTAGFGNASYRIHFIAGTWSGYDPWGEACYS